MIGDMTTTTGTGCINTAPPALEVPHAVASPLTTHVGAELREDSELETCGRVCAAAGSAAVNNVPAVSTLIIKVRMIFPSQSGGEEPLTALRMHLMNAPVVPSGRDQDLLGRAAPQFYVILKPQSSLDLAE